MALDSLLQELTQEHERIGAHLRNVYTLGASSPQARKELRTVRDLLMLHFQRENEEFFPRLRQAAARDKVLKSHLDAFEAENQVIADAMLQFFSTYDSADVSSFHFARDFGALWALITSRMRREENRLFPAYRKASVELILAAR